MSKIIPVILSGGSGTRLWPLSRALYPKQLHQLYSEKSMLQETLLRVSGDEFSDPIVICNNEHRFIIAEQLLEAGIKPRSIILEPVGRNTAPAAAVGAIMLEKSDPDAVMLLMPSDHIIQDANAFAKACRVALDACNKGHLVTFGIKPDAPETGYGYIHQGDEIIDIKGCYAVGSFVEKPDIETAGKYLVSGQYLWNSGMFLFGVGGYLRELEARQPETVAACRRAIEKGVDDLDFFRLDENEFSQAKSDSIDYAVMEHTKASTVVPVEMGWNDVGSWSSLWGVGVKDDNKNVIQGDVIILDSSSSYIRTSGPMVAAVGIEDLVVVCTDDAVLIAPKNRAQDVKGIVDLLRDNGREEINLHSRVHRPWGWYQRIDSGDGFQAKQLMINPGKILSLQRHKHRAEHWVVVSGTARVTRGEEVFDLAVNQSTYIPEGVKHRLENVGNEPLRIIEVQSGSYLGEDDIERFEDVYGRDK